MCGYIGQISTNTINRKNLDLANELIECRGPDKTLKLSPPNKSLTIEGFDQYLIFNRLSIVDLNHNAMQPMYSEETGSLILFNGEIFNHKSLRKELEGNGFTFTTNHSDTEVLLKGLSFFGMDYVSKLNGQFSIVFINYKQHQIHFIRDRMAQKPLFYYQDKDNLLFGSNLKAFIKTRLKKFDINHNSINNYINYGVVPTPDTIIKNIYKVKPSEIVTFQIEKGKIYKKQPRKYWDINKFAELEEEINVNEFSEKIISAINIRQDADVPIANFLSGGIDSSFIVKSINDTHGAVNTFSATYEDLKYDESEWSTLVAKKYDTNHFVNKITLKDIGISLKESIKLFDEPYSDPSTLPSYLLSKAIASKFKVAVSGDGGDELLGGYKRVNDFLESKKKSSKFLERIFSIYPPYFGTGTSILKRQGFTKESYSVHFSDKKFLELLHLKDTKLFESEFFSSHKSDVKSMLLTDYKFYLQEMMMLKVDRTSMANSLEIRSPFVDHNLIEYILSRKEIDLLKYTNKKILKDELTADFGPQFTGRKKMGFVFNLENWIYSNSEEVLSTISDSSLSKLIDVSQITLLFRFKSRINAQRIWKLYFLSIYLEDIT